ncbi:MAG: sigma-B regulation protein RsbU (phosphoserine phosphatase) [Planctomycetota bacterium]|jgi:sigma-B regulation protein RsbU (phosphoserine phosphatase)
MFFRRKKHKEGADKPSAGADSPKMAGESPSSASKDLTTQILTGDSQVDRQTIEVLLDAIARVSESQDDLGTQLRVIVDHSVKITGAERGLLLVEVEDGTLEVRVARSNQGEDAADDQRFSTSIVKKVSKELDPVRATVNSDAEALDLGQSVFDLKLRAVMCVPLTMNQGDGQGERASGVLYVDSRVATRQFSRRDLQVFAALARQISVTLENERLHHVSLEKARLVQESESASEIQRYMMSKVPDGLTSFELFGWYRGADQTSGDFYDFRKTQDGRLVISVGDATGHGVGPALITMSAKASLRSYLRSESDPGTLATLVNEDLCETIDDGRFLTLFIAMLADSGELNFVNAGHCDPIVWCKATGEFVELSGRNPALGMIESIEYEGGGPIQLDSGDVLIAFTDGIVEARDVDKPDELFGVEGLKRAFLENVDKSTEDLTVAMVEEALALSKGVREDDITVVVARRI